MSLLLISLAMTAVLAGYLAVTAWRHRQLRDAIPVRVHVSGTRGKSSTVRLIAAGLRAQNMRVVAKTTGTSPRFIGTDGVEKVWKRRGPASIGEQFRFVRAATFYRAEAIVVEGMAIKPEMVWAFEHHFMNSTVSVITNVRPDHAEELGSEEGAAERSLREAVCNGGRLVVTEEAATPCILQRAADLNTQVTVVETEHLPALAANQELALAVCETLGVPRQLAEAAMPLALTDPGAFNLVELKINGRNLRFANAFAINDAESFSRLWNEIYAQEARSDTGAAVVIFFNIRSDRPLRTVQFLDVFRGLSVRVNLFLHHERPLAARYVRWQAIRHGFKPEMVEVLHSSDEEAVLSRLGEVAADNAIVWGTGNYQGLGEKMIHLLERVDARC